MQYIWKCAIFIAGAGGQINRVAQTMSLARAPWMEHKLLAVSWINLKQRKARLTVKCGGRRAAVQSPGPTGLSRAHREEENAVTRAQAYSSTQDPSRSGMEQKQKSGKQVETESHFFTKGKTVAGRTRTIVRKK